MKKQVLQKIAISLAVTFLVSLLVFVMKGSDKKKDAGEEKIDLLKNEKITADAGAVSSDIKKEEMQENTNKIQKREIGKVPFVLQAPLANWDDQQYENGCEEAAMLMANLWIQGVSLHDPQMANAKIADIARFEDKKFGFNNDIAVEDVASVLKEYFSVKNATILQNVTVDALKNELAQGNIVLAPMHGRALANPNFKRPGPITHMLVIVGYDEKTKQFITNDPGTRRGEKYRYDENVLLDAIWAYPSGKDHADVPAAGQMKKTVLSVGK